MPYMPRTCFIGTWPLREARHAGVLRELRQAVFNGVVEVRGKNLELKGALQGIFFLSGFNGLNDLFVLFGHRKTLFVMCLPARRRAGSVWENGADGIGRPVPAHRFLSSLVRRAQSKPLRAANGVSN